MSEIEEFLDSGRIYDYVIIGDYYVGTYDVIYGKRVRAGRLHDYWCDIDLCMGDSQSFLEQVKRLYEARMHFNYSNGLPIFDGLPGGSDIKPCHNDVFWLSWFVESTKEGWLDDGGNGPKSELDKVDSEDI